MTSAVDALNHRPARDVHGVAGGIGVVLGRGGGAPAANAGGIARIERIAYNVVIVSRIVIDGSGEARLRNQQAEAETYNHDKTADKAGQGGIHDFSLRMPEPLEPSRDSCKVKHAWEITKNNSWNG
jgi:hypothetical protein